MNKRTILLTGITLFICFFIKAQKKILLSNLDKIETNYIFGNTLNISPGDTIAIPSGTYGGLRFYDINGLPGMPITITNQDGEVNIIESTYSAIDLQRSSFVHLKGQKGTNNKYGLKIRSTRIGAQGVNLSNFTTDVEIEGLDICGAGFAGIMVKTNPDCNNPETLRESGFVTKNINIHHNLIRNTLGEGVYVGYTGSSLVTSNLLCEGEEVFAQWMEDVVISDNKFRNIGLDAIQLNLVRLGGIIKNNSIRKYGTKNQGFQQFAMSIGVGQYNIVSNKIINLEGQFGQGIQFLNGFGGSKIVNNVIVNPNFHGIFIHKRTKFQSQQGYLIANNTIISPEKAGIHYNTRITETLNPNELDTTQDNVETFIVNNLIVDPGNDFEGGNTWKQNNESFIDFNDVSTRDGMTSFVSNNMMTRQTEALQLKDTARNKYMITSFNSILVDNGLDISEWNVEKDHKNKPRVSGEAIDIGAYEFQIKKISQRRIERINRKSQTDNKVSVFPNPSPNYFKVQSETYNNAKLNVFNENGVMVHRDKNYKIGTDVDITSMKKGKYFLKLKFEDNSNAHAQLIIED